MLAPRTSGRRLRWLTPLLAGALVPLLAIPAHAADYRYWSFWERGDGGWTYATRGPGTARPSDGDTVGFRYAVGKDAGQDAARPRNADTFGDACAETAARPGAKRVAVVLDFGTAADAPADQAPPKARTACARVDGSASASDALAAVAEPLRYDSTGLLCGVAGYPSSGCADRVSGSGSADADTPAGGERTGDSGPSVGLLGGATAVLVVGAAAAWRARRRRG